MACFFTILNIATLLRLFPNRFRNSMSSYFGSAGSGLAPR